MPYIFFDRTFSLTQSGGTATLTENTPETLFASASDVSSACSAVIASGGYVTSTYVTSAVNGGVSASVASGGVVKNYVTSAISDSVASGGVVNTFVTSAIAAAIPTSSGGAS